jgi:hypothetical protein
MAKTVIPCRSETGKAFKNRKRHIRTFGGDGSEEIDYLGRDNRRKHDARTNRKLLEHRKSRRHRLLWQCSDEVTAYVKHIECCDVMVRGEGCVRRCKERERELEL